MDCECAECTEYGGPDPATMRLRFFFIFTQLFVGLVGMIKARNWKALAAFLSGFTLFWTVPRYLICARCEGYGQNCRSLYLGKITSMYMPKQEGEVGPLGMALELVALSLVSEAPLIGMARTRSCWYCTCCCCRAPSGCTSRTRAGTVPTTPPTGGTTARPRAWRGRCSRSKS